MSGLEIIFLIVAFVTLFAALEVVSSPNLVHSALWLILTLFGVAVTFVLLSATFLAVVQVVVYIGAIAILMIFAIMLTRRVMQDTGTQLNKNYGVAAIFSGVLFVGLATILLNSSTGRSLFMPSVPRNDMVAELGIALVSPNAYLIPFEMASVLLLAALISAIVVAWKK